MSEPQSSGALAVEMAGLDVIPESDRKGKPSDLFMPWFAANISVLGISWGSWVLGFGLSLAQAIVVSVVGVALSFVVCGLIAIAGKRGSAPTLVLSRAAFGFNGNRISAAISWILTVGWETFLAIMAVQATATVMGALGFTNHVVAQIIALILVVVLAAGSGILGFEAIMKVQTWITWATAALTIIYLVLVAPTIDFAVLSSRPSALGAALPTVVLVFFGILLVGSADESLSEAIGNDPIGALTTLLPTWFLVPFALVAILGLIGGIVMDIYSSGLSLLATGVPVSRPVATAIDGTIMTVGTIVVVFFADSFLTPFTAFLTTLGVVIAAWGGVMLADIALRHKDYDEPSLFTPSGRYGSVNWGAVASLIVGSLVGWGLVVNANASWLSWQGYLLGPLGGREGDWAGANIGILLAMVVGFVGYWVTSAGRVRAQEKLPSRTYAEGAEEGEQ
ncbi:MAG: cytosine permease [Actinomyces sp.]|nr:cytosine permease [Actinomyces sp.]